MTQTFRNGQWVQFDKPLLQGVHRTKSGKCVGIWQKSGNTQAGNFLPGMIVVVNEKGEDVMRVSQNQEGLEPLLNRDDLPPGRVVHPLAKLRP